MLLRSGHPVPSDLDLIARGLRGGDWQQYANQVRREVAEMLGAHPANSISDLDHFFTLGLALKSVWPAELPLFDASTSSYLERYGIDKAPALIAFMHGLSGSTFDRAVADARDKAAFSPKLARVQELQRS